LTEVILRRAGAADVPAIHALLAELAAHDGAVLRATEADLRHLGFGAEPRFRAILAEGGGQALGLALYYPEISTLRGRVGIRIEDLYVVQAARGLGLGRRLLARVMDDAQDWGAAYLTLTVDRANAAARAFYGRLGFVDRGSYDLLVLEGEGLSALDTP
jgi:GNAT superfamily N-acetyltransferase